MLYGPNWNNATQKQQKDLVDYLNNRHAWLEELLHKKREAVKKSNQEEIVALGLKELKRKYFRWNPWYFFYCLYESEAFEINIGPSHSTGAKRLGDLVIKASRVADAHVKFITGEEIELRIGAYSVPELRERALDEVERYIESI